MREKGALYLIRSESKIPIFKKINVNKWEYVGKAIITDATNKKELNEINKKPPRDKVQIILEFKFD